MVKNAEMKIRVYLKDRGLRLATAESCTGGLVADRITNVAGSSAYFLGGVVAYSNEVKMSLLGIPARLLEKHGAVSEPVVRAMAEGARKRMGADIAVSISGIAGPGGGSKEKPVGTTWIGLSTSEGSWARHYCWEGGRVKNKISSAEAALNIVLDYLKGKLQVE